MNSRPMILRFCSGSLTPARASRKRFSASTTCRSTPVAATKSRSTCSASPLRSSPWSTKTQVSRSPIARCTTAAATAESTPPLRPQIARPVSPICSRMRSICSSTMLTIVQVGRQPAIRSRKCSSTCWPCSVCITSGCHCTPAKRRGRVLERGDRGGRGLGEDVEALAGRAGRSRRGTSRPGGSPGSSARRVPGAVTRTGVRPNSETPVWATSPPSDLGHRLEAVAHPEDRDLGLEQRRVDRGGAGRVDRGRTAREDDRGRVPGEHLGRPACRAARSRSRPSPRAPGGRSAGRTGLRNRRRERGRGRSRWAFRSGFRGVP